MFERLDAFCAGDSGVEEPAFRLLQRRGHLGIERHTDLFPRVPVYREDPRCSRRLAAGKRIQEDIRRRIVHLAELPQHRGGGRAQQQKIDSACAENLLKNESAFHLGIQDMGTFPQVLLLDYTAARNARRVNYALDVPTVLFNLLEHVPHLLEIGDIRCVIVDACSTGAQFPKALEFSPIRIGCVTSPFAVGQARSADEDQIGAGGLRQMAGQDKADPTQSASHQIGSVLPDSYRCSGRRVQVDLVVNADPPVAVAQGDGGLGVSGAFVPKELDRGLLLPRLLAGHGQVDIPALEAAVFLGNDFHRT